MSNIIASEVLINVSLFELKSPVKCKQTISFAEGRIWLCQTMKCCCDNILGFIISYTQLLYKNTFLTLDVGVVVAASHAEAFHGSLWMFLNLSYSYY